jgi:hypothetical protein
VKIPCPLPELSTMEITIKHELHNMEYPDSTIPLFNVFCRSTAYNCAIMQLCIECTKHIMPHYPIHTGKPPNKLEIIIRVCERNIYKLSQYMDISYSADVCTIGPYPYRTMLYQIQIRYTLHNNILWHLNQTIKPKTGVMCGLTHSNHAIISTFLLCAKRTMKQGMLSNLSPYLLFHIMKRMKQYKIKCIMPAMPCL